MTGSPVRANYKLQQTQNEVQDVIAIMRNNIEKVIDRDQELSNLDDKAEQLQSGARRFERISIRLKRKMCMQNAKMWIILAVALLVVMLIIVLIIVKS